jgi:hypothetical protein
MAGAAKRRKAQRILIWEGAMLARMERPLTLDEYVGEKPRAAPSGMLNMRLRAGARGLKTVSLRKYLESRR